MAASDKPLQPPKGPARPAGPPRAQAQGQPAAAGAAAEAPARSKLGGVVGKVFRFAVPRSIPMAFGQAVKSTGNVRSALAAAKEVQERRRRETKLPIKTIIVRDGDGTREIEMPADPAERFELLYEVHGYDAAYLANQLRAARRAKFACMITSVLCFVLAMVLLVTTSMAWLAMLMIPLSMLMLALCFSMTFYWALIEFQFTKRSLVSYKTFLAQEDFFKWIFS